MRVIRSVPAQFCAADNDVVHIVGSAREAQMTHVDIHVGQWRPLRDTGRAVDLNRLVDDLTGALGHHGLRYAHPDAGLAVAEHIHPLLGQFHFVGKGESSQSFPNVLFITRARDNSDRRATNTVFLESHRSSVDIHSR